MIIVGYHTIMSGLVLRWYHDVTGAERGEERMSVSRDGVLIKCFLHEISDDELDKARMIHKLLKNGRESGLQEARRFATHGTGLFGGGIFELEPRP